MHGLATIRAINAHAAMLHEDAVRKARGLKPVSPLMSALRRAKRGPEVQTLRQAREVVMQGRLVTV